MVAASAPGKVVLSGEYAVLDGAPAISMAVNRRARVCGAAGRASGPERDRALLDAVCAELGIACPPEDLEQDTSAFFAEGRQGRREKLGIGSSAALAAALCTALAPGTGDRAALSKLAVAAHQAFQGGIGSGVDVATCIAGGLVCYRIGEPGAVAVEWPEGLHYRLLWSRVPADTRRKLRHLEARRTQRAASRLASAAEAIARAWLAGDAAFLLRDYRVYIEALRHFDVQHQLGIFSAGHDKLLRSSDGTGVVYKPCGAGGGDIGIALSLDEQLLDRFVASAGRAGFVALDLQLDPEGARRGAP